MTRDRALLLALLLGQPRASVPWSGHRGRWWHAAPARVPLPRPLTRYRELDAVAADAAGHPPPGRARLRARRPRVGVAGGDCRISGRVRELMIEDLRAMAAAARAAGKGIAVRSAYRSYQTQRQVFAGWVGETRPKARSEVKRPARALGAPAGHHHRLPERIEPEGALGLCRLGDHGTRAVDEATTPGSTGS